MRVNTFFKIFKKKNFGLLASRFPDVSARNLSLPARDDFVATSARSLPLLRDHFRFQERLKCVRFIVFAVACQTSAIWSGMRMPGPGGGQQMTNVD